jgi:hypothetical protein
MGERSGQSEWSQILADLVARPALCLNFTLLLLAAFLFFRSGRQA